MKLADLKAGGVYAIRHQTCPHLLLSTDVYKRRTNRGMPSEWSKAALGSRPAAHARRSFSGPYNDFGFVMLEGPDEATITGVDPAPILEALVSGGITAANEIIPDKASVILITSLPSILGVFAIVTAEKAAHKALEMERKQREVNTYNAHVDTLNALAGRDVLQHQRVSESWEPTSTLSLAPSDVRLMAERRDDDTRDVRMLIGAIDRLIDRWADADEAARRALWQRMGEAADAARERFQDRIADLDHRAAQLPDGGLATKP